MRSLVGGHKQYFGTGSDSSLPELNLAIRHCMWNVGGCILHMHMSACAPKTQ